MAPAELRDLSRERGRPLTESEAQAYQKVRSAALAAELSDLSLELGRELTGPECAEYLDRRTAALEVAGGAVARATPKRRAGSASREADEPIPRG